MIRSLQDNNFSIQSSATSNFFQCYECRHPLCSDVTNATFCGGATWCYSTVIRSKNGYEKIHRGCDFSGYMHLCDPSSISKIINGSEVFSIWMNCCKANWCNSVPYTPKSAFHKNKEYIHHDWLMECLGSIILFCTLYAWFLVYLFTYNTHIRPNRIAGSASYSSPKKQDFSQKEPWGTITYSELSRRVGKPFQCYSERIIVNCFKNSGNQRNQFGLGALINNDRISSVEAVRKHIGRGIKLDLVGDSLFLTCRSKRPVFVQSLNQNMNLGMLPSAVTRVKSGHSLKIFDENSFFQLLRSKKSEGCGAIRKMLVMCSIRLSFVKGWGRCYRRQDITSTPCWIEIHMNAALKLSEQIITEITSQE